MFYFRVFDKKAKKYISGFYVNLSEAQGNFLGKENIEIHKVSDDNKILETFNSYGEFIK